MEEITLRIDDRMITCAPGTNLLEAAQSHGIKIPTLCHHPDLTPFGACRICLVEDERNGRLMASCVTPVAPQMRIRTDTPRVVRHRRNIVRLMMAEHPESCLVCSKGNRCLLRKTAGELGVGLQDLYPIPNYKPLEEANPFIIRDLSKCILCGKCIRADHELVAVGAIDFNLRGFRSRPAAAHDLPLEKSSCTFCGTCVSMCPTGALSVKNMGYVGTPEREGLSVCGFCGVGCLLAVGAADDKVVEINPAGREQSVNRSTLCVRGHFANDFLNSSDRIRSPRLREDGDWVIVSWKDSIAHVAERLLEIREKNGPQSVALLGSSKCTNEENYLFQKIARTLLRTNNVDNGGYIRGRSPLKLLQEKWGPAIRPQRLSHLEQAEAIFVLGADPTHSAPVAGYFLKRAARKGIPFLVADPRRIDLVDFAGLWLQVAPGGDTELLWALSALLSKGESSNGPRIDRRATGEQEYQRALADLDLQGLSRRAEIPEAVLRRAAGLLEGKRIAFVMGTGIFQQPHGVATVEAILNLALLTGSLGHEGAGPYVLARENNEAGAWDMGTVPDVLPGRGPLDDPTLRKTWERAWQAKISPDPGLNLVRMLEEAERGNLKAIYIMGENPLRALPDPDRVRRALERVDFLVVQDILETETAALAHAVLPGAAFAEKGGSFTNMEGRIQAFEPVVHPPGEARADWQILDHLARELGDPVHYGTLERIRSEIARLVPGYQGIKGLKGGTWVQEVGNTSSPLEFSTNLPEAPTPSPQEYPFTAILGSRRYHLGCGTRTGRSQRIRALGLEGGEAGISKEDAEALKISDGDRICVISKAGSIVREARLDNRLPEGQVFVPTALHQNDAMRLIPLSDLEGPDSPGWKTCAVRIEKE